ncbi:MAG TPA: hypothetical protein VE818_11710 [Nitrososphaeraceae archaeon]|nr:hypothetical protein [Nitrososphaeraceae archaeon]
MGQGDIGTVKEQATEEMTTLRPPSSPNATTYMTENVPNNASRAGANASQTGKSIVNKTVEAAQTLRL